MSQSRTITVEMKCLCGCGDNTGFYKKTWKAKGMIAGMPIKFLPGHQHYNKKTSRAARSLQSLPERFSQLYMPEPNSGCWLWEGWTRKDGYGEIRVANELRFAHRVSYELSHGVTLKREQHIDHLCRVRCCVNPYHLEVVTNKVNVLRGISPAARNSRKTHCKRGHPLIGQNIYNATNRNERVCKVCHRDRYKQYKMRQLERTQSSDAKG